LAGRVAEELLEAEHNCFIVCADDEVMATNIDKSFVIVIN
jgi:hypothetical protein